MNDNKGNKPNRCSLRCLRFWLFYSNNTPGGVSLNCYYYHMSTWLV